MQGHINWCEKNNLLFSPERRLIWMTKFFTNTKPTQTKNISSGPDKTRLARPFGPILTEKRCSCKIPENRYGEDFRIFARITRFMTVESTRSIAKKSYMLHGAFFSKKFHWNEFSREKSTSMHPGFFHATPSNVSEGGNETVNNFSTAAWCNSCQFFVTFINVQNLKSKYEKKDWHTW